MKRLSFFFAFLILVSCLSFAPASALADGDDADGLCFNSDGTFTVMLLSDLQETQFTTELVISGETHVLADYPADLIVLLGDQLEGASPVLRFGNGSKNCEDTIRAILAPVAASGIPFAVVFGNHDNEAPISIADQVAIYESYDTCVGVCFGKNADESGAFSLPVYTDDGQTKALDLYFFDCGPTDSSGDYGAVSAEQVAWYTETSQAEREANANQNIPAVAFSHIVVPEVYELFTQVDEGTDGAFKGVGSGRGGYYVPNDKRIFLGDVNEAPCPSSKNNGLFDAFVDNGDVFLTVSGHDHVNSFIGTLRGVDIASVPGSSYTSYGESDIRGVRLFRFSEYNVQDYATIHVLYSDYDTPASYGYVRYYLTTTTKIYNAVKVVVLALVLLAALIVLTVVFVRRRKRRPQPALPEADAAAPPENEPGPPQNGQS